MGHYTIRTNDDEDQAIKKAQEATGQASASKTFMTAILSFSVTETRWRSYGVNWRRKSAESGAGIIGKTIPFQPEQSV